MQRNAFSGGKTTNEWENQEFFNEKYCQGRAADCLIERRLLRRAMEEQRRHQHHRPQRAQLAMDEKAVDEEDEEVHELRELFKREDDVISRMSAMSRRSNQTEDLADFDDNISTIVLDHYLPLSRSSRLVLSSKFSGENPRHPCSSKEARRPIVQ
ncbi:hypothetical protein ANCDUO_07724 [Ancylostoma duodenale]|uniref:Uncharacterized protein n=1 Tax=Ancylostoma duodenale TaxID=51022 RepID=A0A0C2GXX0_9BILA|nr:hypothetical protein ANCDUO_07724 [Ancylostoma duodenale]